MKKRQQSDAEEPTDPEKDRKSAARGLLLGVVVVVLAMAAGFLMFSLLRSEPQEPKPPITTVTQLEEKIKDDPSEINKLTVDPNTETVQISEDGHKPYSVAVPRTGASEGLDRVLRMARKENITVAAKPLELPEPSSVSKFIGLIPTAIIVVIIIWLAMSYGLFSGGRSSTDPKRSKVSFADVAGCDEAVEELRDVRSFLRDAARFEKLGARVPKGVLLYGPPGTGKTLLAKAIAREADIPFFSASGAQFVEMFAGLGARRVRQIFKKAKGESDGAIIFIDELDAVGGHRSSGPSDGGTREADQTLVALLNEMDGFEVSEHPVIVIGATNRLEALDPALTRPGRFDRHISIDPPDRAGRIEILKVHSQGKPLGGDVDLELVATQTSGMTGADLALLLNEAALLAARRGGSEITDRDIDGAFFRIIAGVEKANRSMTEEEREKVAYHETGHALVQEQLGGTEKVHKISIIPRGPSAGQTVSVSEKDVVLYSEQALRNQLAGLLAGRAAEEMIFGEISSGAASDLKRASELAEQMITKLGMGETLGLKVALDDLSAQARREVEEEIKRLLDAEYARATEILISQRELIEIVASRLLEDETLDRELFLELIGSPVSPTDPSAVRAPVSSGAGEKPRQRRGGLLQRIRRRQR